MIRASILRGTTKDLSVLRSCCTFPCKRLARITKRLIIPVEKSTKNRTRPVNLQQWICSKVCGCTAQHGTVQHSAAQCSTDGTSYHSTSQHIPAQCSTVQHRAPQSVTEHWRECSVLYSTVSHCTAQPQSRPLCSTVKHSMHSTVTVQSLQPNYSHFMNPHATVPRFRLPAPHFRLLPRSHAC